MINYIKLLRPHQWAKQSIVFIPILSLGESIDIRGLAQGMAAVISFTFIASSVYIVNDYFDSGEDRLDPIRKNRPLASGLVSKSLIKLLLLLLLCGGLFLNALFSKNSLLSATLLLFYLLLNVTYSKFHLKNQGVLGISIVAFGFPLRFAFGCIFLDILISYWALVLLMELALFMLSVKRYQRTIRRGSAAGNDSKHEFWLFASTIFAAFFSASYAGFISTPSTQIIWGANALLLSAIPMALAVVRFLEIATQPKNWNSGDVTDSVFKDLPLNLLAISYGLILLIGSITHG